MKKTKAQHNKGDLQVWWVPQVPMKSFEVPVSTLREARLILDTLAKYDLFQFDNRVKPDFCNTGGLRVWSLNSDGEGNPGWTDWHGMDGDEFDDIPDDRLDRAVWEEAAR
jgi:hypothetical protein